MLVDERPELGVDTLFGKTQRRVPIQQELKLQIQTPSSQYLGAFHPDNLKPNWSAKYRYIQLNRRYQSNNSKQIDLYNGM